MKYKNYKYIKYLTLKGNLRYSSFIQHLLSMNKALGSKNSTTIKSQTKL